MITKIPYDQPVPEEIVQYIEVLCQDVDTAVSHCTPYGKGLKLLSNKPEDLYYAYVWRMARFNGGDDMKMPIGAFFDISAALEGDFEMQISFHMIDESRKRVLDLLDTLSDKLLGRIGLSTTRAAHRWSGALAGASLEETLASASQVSHELPADKAAEGDIGNLKVGDILHGCIPWGMATHHFFQITKISSSTVLVQSLSTETLSNDGMYLKKVPTTPITPIGEPRRRKIYRGGAHGDSVRISDYLSASLWDGEPVSDSLLD